MAENKYSRNSARGRIAQVLAHARVESEGLAPSLDFPSRP
eukprot:CAMPEP_0173204344 /NCGR_PEP_ID=MMETSP1141-20130122/20055_1 /TAXON_ID=483371 /ORGANISM="non described non described, Strain CCMP2298" /LENGTH=39 /DNA_ID= /DNA_START= /DNA_END= /DNA_ORIENTATION=